MKRFLMTSVLVLVPSMCVAGPMEDALASKSAADVAKNQEALDWSDFYSWNSYVMTLYVFYQPNMPVGVKAACEGQIVLRDAAWTSASEDKIDADEEYSTAATHHQMAVSTGQQQFWTNAAQWYTASSNSYVEASGHWVDAKGHTTNLYDIIMIWLGVP